MTRAAASTVQGPLVMGGLALTMAAAAADGNQWVGTGNEYLVIYNTHASAARTATVTSRGTYMGLAVANSTLVVAAGKVGHMGPFPPNLVSPAGENVYVDWSDAGANITFAVVKRN